MVLPLGLVALYWIRMFKPLVARRLPQLPGGSMGFVKEAFHRLAAVAPFDLRPGATFHDETAAALRRALADAARVIAEMPARHLTFADDRPVFLTEYGRIPRGNGPIALDLDTLWEYGTTRVPLAVWQALRRMSAWIEPMLLAEWVRLTQSYAARESRAISTDEVLAALRWIEPERDTAFARNLARARLSHGEAITCVWSGRKLREGALDIDHCLPWSAWPCGDLWNLLPSSPAVNQHAKRERIVTAGALAEARPRIIAWWQDTYVAAAPPVQRRFAEEARTTLPLPLDRHADLEDLFSALDFRRLRLLQETQLPQWPGAAASA